MTPPPPDPEPTPTLEDWWRAKQLGEGAGADPELVRLFARGIAIARTGGDVRAFLLRELTR